MGEPRPPVDATQLAAVVEQARGTMTRFMGFWFVVMGLFGLIVVSGIGWWLFQAKNWPTAEATVVHSSVIPLSRYDSSQKRDILTYRTTVEFRFTVGGRGYQVRDVATWEDSGLSAAHLRKYAQGSRHTILYNPADPSSIRLTRPSKIEFWALVIFGAFSQIFTVIGLVVMYGFRPKAVSQCSSCGKPVQKGQNFCPNCAAPLPVD